MKISILSNLADKLSSFPEKRRFQLTGAINVLNRIKPEEFSIHELVSESPSAENMFVFQKDDLRLIITRTGEQDLVLLEVEIRKSK